jgi:hypothetical protein
MTMRTYTVIVRGKSHEWGFRVKCTEADAADWRADGFDVYEEVNTIPFWVPAPLIPLWCRAQDLWNWPSTWGRG